METLAIVIGWILAIFIAGVEIILLVKMISGTIDLKQLISEPPNPNDPKATSGDASMSRFQFLVFTFVIATSLFLIVAATQRLPEVPTSIVGLLGVSGGSYVISKGIQANRDTTLAKKGNGSGGTSGTGGTGGTGGTSGNGGTTGTGGTGGTGGASGSGGATGTQP